MLLLDGVLVLAPSTLNINFEQQLGSSAISNSRWTAPGRQRLAPGRQLPPQISSLQAQLNTVQISSQTSQVLNSGRPPLLAKRGADEAPSRKFGSDLLLRSY